MNRVGVTGDAELLHNHVKSMYAILQVYYGFHMKSPSFSYDHPNINFKERILHLALEKMRYKINTNPSEKYTFVADAISEPMVATWATIIS